MRAGEVLETVPGVVISQHSGEGKANQYYLRGFNLDHGTDFATTVAGMPVNMPTHGHGQGYPDLNFLIPNGQRREICKGPYFADQGDFAMAGAANINYVNTLSSPSFGSAAVMRGLVGQWWRLRRAHRSRPSADCARSGTERWPVGHTRSLQEGERSPSIYKR